MNRFAWALCKGTKYVCRYRATFKCNFNASLAAEFFFTLTIASRQVIFCRTCRMVGKS